MYVRKLPGLRTVSYMSKTPRPKRPIQYLKYAGGFGKNLVLDLVGYKLIWVGLPYITYGLSTGNWDIRPVINKLNPFKDKKQNNLERTVDESKNFDSLKNSEADSIFLEKWYADSLSQKKY